MARDLTDRVIVITGASSGIGAATALACAEAGMDVVLGARREDRLREVAEQVQRAGRRAITMACDVDRDADVERLAAQAESHFGRLDAAFANAGYGLYASVAETSDAAMHAIFETNFHGTMRLIRAVVPALERREDGGHVLICSSAVSEIGLPMYGAYCATKAAQDAIASAMRGELADRGIRVSSVHPVGTRTDFFETARVRSNEQTATFNTPSALQQTAAQVARAVLRCLRRPRAEVWPHWPTRLGLAMVTAFPALGAMSMRGLYRKRYAQGTGQEGPP